jgi:hypothetical protein
MFGMIMYILSSMLYVLLQCIYYTYIYIIYIILGILIITKASREAG